MRLQGFGNPFRQNDLQGDLEEVKNNHGYHHGQNRRQQPGVFTEESNIVNQKQRQCAVDSDKGK
jgi:hypothetical protein